MFELTVITDFGAAHRVVDYPGKCNRLHGHNWIVEVTVAGEKLNELGMLVDFKSIKKEVAALMEELDHHFLNELPAFAEKNPTAENIAVYIFDELEKSALFTGGVAVKAVKVWESLKSAVTYTKD
jgi:6-pyruvoyltetrahydropterin/6-carboxytetrahydropterin synthase